MVPALIVMTCLWNLLHHHFEEEASRFDLLVIHNGATTNSRRVFVSRLSHATVRRGRDEDLGH